MSTFYELKSKKWEQPLNISENGFYEQVLEFHLPSKLLCQTVGRQIYWPLFRIQALSLLLRNFTFYLFSDFFYLNLKIGAYG
jgi:hypothetical protein